MGRLRRKPPSPTTGETRINARPSDQYAARKAALADPQVRLSLDLVEESIAVDPHHRLQRREVGDVVWDTSEPGIALAFAIEGDSIVYLTFVLLFER